MLILAVESSAKPVSVAVYQAPDGELANNGKLLGQYFQNNGFSHSRTLMAMTESILKNLEIDRSDIGLIAVSNGPGSFTGVRIGVSAVKGLAWGLDIPVCGVSTLEAMAYQIPDYDGMLCTVMDARRDQVYNALFENRSGKLNRLCDDRAISLEELAADLNKYNTRCLLVGDGTDVCISYPDLSGYPAACEQLRFQTAYGVALAAVNGKHIPPEELEPCYLRPSQAEREYSQSSSKSSS